MQEKWKTELFLTKLIMAQSNISETLSNGLINY